MTEKEVVLGSVVEYFMREANIRRSQNTGNAYEDGRAVISASNCDWAATEVAGLGAATETIDKAVRLYMGKVKVSFLDSQYMHSAMTMAKKGASKAVVEELIALLLRKYHWIWALEDLTKLAGRKPTTEEIFQIVQLERKDMTSMSSDMHERYIGFARKYLHTRAVDEIKTILDDKVREWESHIDI